MKKAINILFAMVLVGCVSQEPMVREPAVHRAAAPSFGQSTANELTELYNDTRQNCGSDSKPAFLCTGVMLRGTEYSTAYDSWNPSPASVTSGGVSFSYLRADSKFSRLAYNYQNGFIVYPIFRAPDDKIDLQVLCSFPHDAATLGRAAKGCGAHSQTPAISRPCVEQNVVTAEQWKAHFEANPTVSRYARQCGFDLRDETNQLAGPAFWAHIRSRNLLNFFTENDELRVATWQQNIAPTLPIKAFFYISSAALPSAQGDQRRFKEKSGIAVPIIKLTMPATAAQDVRFEYIAADQVVVPDSLPAPSVEGASNGTLDPGQVPAAGAVTWVPAYANMRVKDRVNIRWTGAGETYNSPAQYVSSIGSMRFVAPKSVVTANAGRSVVVTYAVKPENAPNYEVSQALTLRVQ